jgi:hypothetical protein
MGLPPVPAHPQGRRIVIVARFSFPHRCSIPNGFGNCLASRPVDIRMPIENIYFWPTVDVRDIESTWAAY